MADETKDETIDRLIKENSFVNRIINETKIELSEFGDIHGMSFISAVKALIKKYKDSISENTKLKDEIKNLKNIRLTKP